MSEDKISKNKMENLYFKTWADNKNVCQIKFEIINIYNCSHNYVNVVFINVYSKNYVILKSTREITRKGMTRKRMTRKGMTEKKVV